MRLEIHSLKTMTKTSVDQAWQEQIAWDILQKHAGAGAMEIAWISHKEQVFYAVASGQKAQSAVIKLIQHLFDQYIDHSFFVLRNRIFTNVALSEASKGMVRIAAKRAEGEIHPTDHQRKYAENLIQVGEENTFFLQSRHIERLDIELPAFFDDTDQIRKALENIKSSVGRGEILHDHNRSIAVIATDKDLRLLGWSANSNSKNKTLHAEVRLVQDFLQKQKKFLPKETRFFVSLKPCRMCAAMIVEACEDPASIEVLYLEEDLGSLAQGTMLDILNVNRLWP